MTIQVNGRIFSVTATEHAREGVQYTLSGKRGATYKTMRNANRRELMFLVNARGFGIPAGFEGKWFTDIHGTLEAAR